MRKRNNASLALAALIGAQIVMGIGPAQPQVGQPSASGSLEAAVASGNAAAIRAMISNSPGQAEYIAVTLAQMARGMTATNPRAAVFAISEATAIAGTMVEKSPAVASQIAVHSISVAESPALIQANPAAVAQIAVNAAKIVSVPGIIQSDRKTALSVAQRAQSVVLNLRVLPKAPQAAASVSDSLARVVRFTRTTASPATVEAAKNLKSSETWPLPIGKISARPGTRPRSRHWK
jgi:hypothetical protein